jgi:act minimal PKS acyl carrier protein
MTTFTVTKLKEMMLSTADGAGLELPGDFLDTPFPDLDFDSLAVLELATRVQQGYDLAIPDEAVADMITPRDVLDYVTRRLSETV